MMPLPLAADEEECIIRRIGGTAEVKRHLENLGFVVGGSIRIIARVNDNLIVNVKEARVALDQKLAQKIMV